MFLGSEVLEVVVRPQFRDPLFWRASYFTGHSMTNSGQTLVRKLGRQRTAWLSPVSLACSSPVCFGLFLTLVLLMSSRVNQRSNLVLWGPWQDL